MTRIAVVEDNPDNRMLVEALLEDDYELDLYEDGGQALDGIKLSPPQLILLDISLPGMDGTEVMQTLRADERLQNIPIVALTAHAMGGDKERFLALGFDDYVSKPIVDEELLFSAIARHLKAQE